jgi:hypothetical protein
MPERTVLTEGPEARYCIDAQLGLWKLWIEDDAQDLEKGLAWEGLEKKAYV